MNKQKYIIKIDDLENTPSKTLEVIFEDYLPEIKSKDPIIANLTIKSLGDYVEINGSVSGISQLVCDLCLEEYDHELNLEIEELFAKKTYLEEYGQETEIKDGQFVTDLKGDKEIDICDLLYQSVILDFPNKKVCGINCKGGDIFIRDENFTQQEADPRMAVFKDIKLNKDKNK